MTEVVIVGGGPVGLAAAIEARLAGLGATVVEPRMGPIDKACGEGLMPGALPLLHRLGVDPEGMPLLGVTYTNGRRRVDHRFRTGPGRGVRRTTLHAALAARAAELGVQRIDAKADAVHQDADGVSVAGVRGDWLLAVDGLHSAVRRTLGLERRASGPRRFGLRKHYRVAPWTDLIEVHWPARGEVYVTPVAPDVVGLSLLGAPHTDFDETIAAIPELHARVADAPVVSELRGSGPFAQRASTVRSGRVLLVGDASGYVDAITGEGLRLGFAQARAAVSAIVADGPQDYPAAWAKVTRDFRVLTSGLVRAASSPLRGGIVPLANAAPWLYGAVVERLAR